MRRSRTILTTAFGLTGLAILAACTSSGGASSAGGDLRGQQAAVPSAASGGGAAGGAGSAFAGHGAAARPQDVTAVKPTAASLIITASMSVSVPRTGTVDAAASRAENLADGAGGRVDSDDRTEAITRASVPSAVLTLRVPDPDVAGVLDRLATLGRATGRQLHTRDVTSTVVDVASRVASARAAIASLDTLYKRATRVRDIITIETTLAQREADLESLEAQLNALQGRVALATITLTLTGHRQPAAVVHRGSSGPGGVLGGLEDGWHAFATTVVGIVTGLAAALPFLAVIAGLAIGTAVVWRRSRRVRPVRTPGSDA